MILESNTLQDVSNEAFPFMASEMITISDVPTRASRITYFGELGWEFYCRSEYALTLWQNLIEAGKSVPKPTHMRQDLVLPLPSTRKRTSSESQRETINKNGVARRLQAILIRDITRIALGNDPVRHEGQVIGRIKSGGQGHTIGKSIAYADLPTEHAEPGTKVEIEIFGEWIDGTNAKDLLFDSTGERIKT